MRAEAKSSIGGDQDGATFLSLARLGSVGGISTVDAALWRLLSPPLPASFWASVYRLTTGEAWPPETSASARSFVENCYWHGLLPLLFAEVELPPAVQRAREMARGGAWILAHRSDLLQTAIVAVCRILADEPFALIKGADYAHRLYPAPSMRAMQDIDVLVPAERLDAVCRRLRDAGLVPAPAAGVAADPAHHERSFAMGELLVEIHQAFVQRRRHRIDYDAVLRRRVPLEIAGQPAFRLDDVDALAYHALSMAMDQYHVRFIRFVDLWILLGLRSGIACAAAERARDWQAARALYGALSLAGRLFPEFHTSDVGAAKARLLSGPTRRFVDRWVLPAPAEYRHRTRPRRRVQLWRKACLMDTSARRAAFALSHATAALRARLTEVTKPGARGAAASPADPAARERALGGLVDDD